MLRYAVILDLRLVYSFEIIFYLAIAVLPYILLSYLNILLLIFIVTYKLIIWFLPMFCVYNYHNIKFKFTVHLSPHLFPWNSAAEHQKIRAVEKAHSTHLCHGTHLSRAFANAKTHYHRFFVCLSQFPPTLSKSYR